VRCKSRSTQLLTSVLSSIRPIAAGDEITCRYTDLTLWSSAERQEYTRSQFGFTCTCPACARPPEELLTSDLRLAEYNDIYDTHLGYGRPSWYADRTLAHKSILRAIDIAIKEDKVIQICESWESLFNFCAEWGWEDEAKVAASKSEEAYAAIGHTAFAEEMKGHAERPQGYPTWSRLAHKLEKEQVRQLPKITKYSRRPST
jgi:hypothetical protein